MQNGRVSRSKRGLVIEVLYKGGRDAFAIDFQGVDVENASFWNHMREVVDFVKEVNAAVSGVFLGMVNIVLLHVGIPMHLREQLGDGMVEIASYHHVIRFHHLSVAEPYAYRSVAFDLDAFGFPICMHLATQRLISADHPFAHSSAATCWQVGIATRKHAKHKEQGGDVVMHGEIGRQELLNERMAELCGIISDAHLGVFPMHFTDLTHGEKEFDFLPKRVLLDGFVGHYHCALVDGYQMDELLNHRGFAGRETKHVGSETAEVAPEVEGLAAVLHLHEIRLLINGQVL